MTVIKNPLFYVIILAALLANLMQMVQAQAVTQDTNRYRSIFALQEIGAWDEADLEIATLQDDALMGYVLFQRYMHPTLYRSSYQELYDWLARYADHQGADRIYKLAMRRKPSNAQAPSKPFAAPFPAQYRFDPQRKSDMASLETRAKPTPIRYSNKASKERRYLLRQIQAGYVTRSLKRLESANIRKLFSKSALADLYGYIARGYYRYHKNALAVSMAEKAAIHDKTINNARWWAGLAAWRMADYALAGRLFEEMAMTEYHNERRDAAAFWASRAWLRAKQPQRVRLNLDQVPATSRSFYGLLALRAGGRSPVFDWQIAVNPAFDSLNPTQNIGFLRRALALYAAGMDDMAYAEWKGKLNKLSSNALAAALPVIDQLGYAHLAHQIGMQFYYRRQAVPDRANYPLPSWQSLNGHKIDRALLFAFMRQESRFNPQAKSRSGALGLMQLMPATARYISRISDFPYDPKSLTQPALNLALGQNYLMYLMENAKIQGNLFYMCVGYNAGPGNLERWRAQFEYHGDPLLFIETLPSLETRNYVEKILANLWIYRYRLGQSAPSMENLLQGSWPIYTDLEPRTIKIDRL